MTQELNAAVKALHLKMDKSITGEIKYDLFEAQALLNAIEAYKQSVRDLYLDLSELTNKFRKGI